jgi:hypothetical protein
MGILAVKVLAIWSFVDLVIGFALGAVIRKGERLRKDAFLTALFATLASQQESR